MATTIDPARIDAAKAVFGIDPDTLDRTLPGVLVLANRLDELLSAHVDLAQTWADTPGRRDSRLRDALAESTARLQATWHAAHLVTGAEQQARSTVDGILRPYVVDADRHARLGWLDHIAGDDLDLPNAHSRAAGRVRGIVRDLAARHYATEEGALP